MGDSSKAREKIGWKPTITFEALVKDMMDSDLDLMRRNPNA